MLPHYQDQSMPLLFGAKTVDREIGGRLYKLDNHAEVNGSFPTLRGIMERKHEEEPQPLFGLDMVRILTFELRNVGGFCSSPS